MVFISLVLAALNSLDVMATDIVNVYITCPYKKRFRPLLVLNSAMPTANSMKSIIVCTLYRLNSVGRSFREILADFIYSLGYKSFLADSHL